jgi:replicative DNA helicase
MINEARLLSAVINNKDIAPVLNSQNVDMLFTSHEDIWKFTKEYFIQNRAIVPSSILNEHFPDFRVMPEAETAGTVKHYLEQLRDEYTAVLLDRIAVGVSKDLGVRSNKAILGKLASMVSDLTKVTSGIRDLDITDPVKANEHYAEMKRLMELNGGVMGIRSGFDAIDACYPTGFAPGQYIIVISRTNQGKSWIALDLAINAWALGHSVLYASLEMSPQSVRDRAYTLMSEGKFKMSDLSRAQIDLLQMEEWTAEKMNKSGSFIVTSSDGMGDFSPAQLQGKIEQYGADIVFVDYLQLMIDNRGSTGETERIRNVSKELKSLSMSAEVPIIAVAAASSNDTKEYSKPPEIYEFAGSRQAAYDADLVLSLFSHKQHDGSLRTEIVAKKNRNGPLFDFVVKLDIESGTITEEFNAGLLENDE